MRMSDLSSDVCSSDLADGVPIAEAVVRHWLGTLARSTNRSAIDCRELSREVSNELRLMKWVPELSTLPSEPGAPVALSTKSTSKVRSRAPAAKNGVLLTRNGANEVSCGVMPCSEIGRASCRARVWQYV